MHKCKCNQYKIFLLVVNSQLLLDAVKYCWHPCFKYLHCCGAIKSLARGLVRHPKMQCCVPWFCLWHTKKERVRFSADSVWFWALRDISFKGTVHPKMYHSFNHLHVVPGNIKEDMLMNVKAALFHTVSEWGLSISLPLNIMEKSGLGIQITLYST